MSRMIEALKARFGRRAPLGHGHADPLGAGTSPTPETPDAETPPAPAAGSRPTGIRTRLAPRRGPKAAGGSDARLAGVVAFDGVATVTAGKRRYALGLEIEPFPEGTNVEELAEQLSVTRELDLHGFHPEGGQVLFASREQDHAAGDYPGIRSLDRARLGNTWVAVFHLTGAGDAWWLVALRDGAAYEDRVFLQEDAARKAFGDLVEAPGWESVIAPEGWTSHGAHAALDLAACLAAEPPSERLTKLNARRRRVKIMAATFLGLCLAGGAGVYVYGEILERQRVQEELRRARMEATRLSEEAHPWFGAPVLSDFVAACMTHMETAFVLVPGWSASDLVCGYEDSDTVSISTSWRRVTGGNFAWLRGAVAPRVDGLSMASTGDDATLTATFPIQAEARPFTRETWTQQEIRTRLVERRQVVGLSLSLEPDVTRMTVSQRQSMRVPVFNSMRVTVETVAGIRDLPRYFSDIPALTPERLVYDPSDRSWDLEMRIYLPPIIPLPSAS